MDKANEMAHGRVNCLYQNEKPHKKQTGMQNQNEYLIFKQRRS